METRRYDPLLYMVPLPHVIRCYPYGFPADIASDSLEVLEAARESWGMYDSRFDRQPIRVHVIVSNEDGGVPPAPVLRGQRHLLTWVADRHNFSAVDRLQRFGYACVTRATVMDRIFFRWHFLNALVYMLLELNYITSLHAACVAWKGAGVLLYGESGIGKTTLSYACARRGWTYISDDSSSVLWGGGRTVLGEPHHFRFRCDATEVFPELRGLTVGYPLGRKPTIEVLTADLSIHTAFECSVEWIVFLDRRRETDAGLSPLTAAEVRQRLLQDMALFDPDLESQRRSSIEAISEVPAFELRYSSFEEALRLLEETVRK
jgi:hypothetical protein